MDSTKDWVSFPSIGGWDNEIGVMVTLPVERYRQLLAHEEKLAQISDDIDGRVADGLEEYASALDGVRRVDVLRKIITSLRSRKGKGDHIR